MLRNLFAIILATIIGLAVARLVEGVIGGGVAPGETADAKALIGLSIGYFVGAFVAAGLALLIGRRWAPLGWLGAGTVLFAAVITLLTFKLPLFLWPVSAAACGAGGWLAIRLLKGAMQFSASGKTESLFDD